MTTLPFPCPVRLGFMKSDGPEAQLHRYTMEKNLTKMEKLLRKGVDVDCINHLGQTPLFCAALMGHEAVAELLLQYRADPNHRCKDWSTPVHAAVFSCNPWLLSCLLDSGGDIRLHDQEGRVPVDWLTANTQEHRVCEMTEFLKSCTSHVQQSYQSPGIRELNQSTHFISTSSKILLRTSSMLGLIKSRGLVQQLHKKSYNKGLCTTAQCFGFGKVCIDKPCQSLGVLASIPLIKESDLTQADDETLYSFNCGSLISMTNYSWKGSRVTVKQMKASKAAYKDLLLTEQDYCRQQPIQHRGIKSEEKREVKIIEQLTEEGSISSHSVEDYLEPESKAATQMDLPTGGLRLSEVRQEQISSIVLNLKVSQEESNSDVDQSHTTLKPCPIVHNPDPEEKMDPATQSQTQDPGSEEAGDVIPVVSRPEAIGSTPGVNIKHSVDSALEHPSGLLKSPDGTLAGSTGRAQCAGEEQRGEGREAVEGMQEEQHAQEAGVCAELDEGDRSGQQGDGKTHCVEAAEHAGPEHRSTAEQPKPGACGGASVMNREFAPELKGLLDNDNEEAIHKACADECVEAMFPSHLRCCEIIVPGNLNGSTVLTVESHMMRGPVGAGLLLKSANISMVFIAFSSKLFWLHQEARWSTSFK
ncbi:unnamed protein product [Lota lota]